MNGARIGCKRCDRGFALKLHLDRHMSTHPWEIDNAAESGEPLAAPAAPARSSSRVAADKPSTPQQKASPKVQPPEPHLEAEWRARERLRNPKP